MTSFDHRLGFPPALLAFESEPRKPQRTPLVQKLSEAEQAARRLQDVEPTPDKWTYCINPQVRVVRRFIPNDFTTHVEVWMAATWLPSTVTPETAFARVKSGTYILCSNPELLK